MLYICGRIKMTYPSDVSREASWVKRAGRFKAFSLTSKTNYNCSDYETNFNRRA